MQLPEKFISCDWGTSNFRLRVIHTHTGAVVEESQTDKGVKAVYQDFLAQDSLSQEAYFAAYLESQIATLKEANKDKNFVVASGMVSSSIGMKDIPYAFMPFPVTGEGLESAVVPISKELTALIISGACIEDNVMRGEEIQALGLVELLPLEEKGVLLLPGTHSKHIAFDQQSFTQFETYMTGERFEVLTKHSILGGSTIAGEFTQAAHQAFVGGVQQGAADGAARHLFKIRATDVLGKRTKADNFYYLSGLLIGEELSYLDRDSEKICLAASGKLCQLYSLALEELITDQKRLLFLTEKNLENALITGHRKVLEAYAKSSEIFMGSI